MEKVRFFDRKTLPSQTITEAVVTRSNNGVIQMEMQAPIIEQYDQPEQKTVYPKGVVMHFYNEVHQPTAMLSAHYGVSYDSRNLMEARDSVIIIDYRTGDTSYLSEIFWDSEAARIYSNKPVRSVNGQRVTIGDGFESDENFDSPQILHQRGTVLVED